MPTEQAIREAKNRWARRRRRLIGYGQWQPFTDAARVREHVLAIQATGMGLAGIAKHTSVGIGTLEYLLYRKDQYGPAAAIRTESAQALLAYWPALDDYEDGANIDATGTRRRLQALAKMGWSSKAIHQRIDCSSVQTLERLRYRTKVTAKLARAIRDVYNDLSAKAAEEHGVHPSIASRSRTYATRYGWAGPEAWDPDTIDDPDAKPDWTGHCGTDRGWWLHRLEGIPVCQPCEAAHGQWKAERAHLTHSERWRELAQARGEARSREVDLAHDGRELLRHGVDIERVAERLGVTRNHLQQAMLRHSADEAVAA
ncbi:hypothetical protein AB0E62_35935 [Streptomyces sp. NPDC038707]|uniref:hypothetical protein n=1 Tax=Streptomyces sp. NPDC038707 TaxID=3154329 RepID=UPI0033D8A9E1